MPNKPIRDIQVCVIGGGVCGIVSVKICLETGLKVSCYEKSSNYGGLWCYRNGEDDSHVPSVMKTTILNTSKELSAFSDFPPPPNLANYMKHTQYMDYIKSYVKHFELLPHINLGHEILQCKPDFEKETNEFKWLITIKDLKDNRVFIRKFDKVMIAVGHHNIPFIPKLPNQHKFKGQIIHSGLVKDILNDERFKDKNVVVVGGGNSACDAAVDLALVTNKCYSSCHRGNWFFSRLSPKGLSDFEVRTKWNHFRSTIFPSKLVDRQTVKRIKKRVNHKLLGLTPKHLPSEAIPAINDLFPYRVFTGGITMKSAISCMTEDGCIFEGEDEECKVDVVMLATGYTAKVSFLNEFELGIRSVEHDGEYNLFLNIFAPLLTITKSPLEHELPEAIKSLAYIGLTQPSGSITVVSELQSRLAAQVFAGKLELPSIKDMCKDIKKVRLMRLHSIRSHSRDQLIGPWIGYLDKVGAILGVKPNLGTLFFKDFPLWKRLMFGPSVPYQYRLSGPGSWNKARETIMSVDERAYQGINDGKNHILFKTRRKQLQKHENAAANLVCSDACINNSSILANGLAKNDVSKVAASA